jgi:hypothetical protein
MNMSRHTSNVMSQIAEDVTQCNAPYIGMPVTINYYTDRRAATVVRVINEKEIAIQDNKTKTIDYYAGTYEVLPDLEGAEQVFTKRKNGRWVAVGQCLRKGLGISLGMHDHWIDPNF